MLEWGKIKTGLNSFSTNTACNLEVVAMVMAAHMSMFANNALLRGGVRVRAWIREQRKIKRRSEALLNF